MSEGGDIRLSSVEGIDHTCAVGALTPDEGPFLFTYYDVCPWSPSGRYFVCLRLPFEDRAPAPDDQADLCLFDLARATWRVVYRTTAWGSQTAAKQQWGRTDRYLYLNDRRDGEPVGVRYDLQSGSVTALDGPVWQVAPDESYAVCPCLIRANLTQPGYGVSVRPEDQIENTRQVTPDDGFFRVDLATGRRRLLVSLADVWEAVPDKDALRDTVLYAFHCKINAQGTRLLLVARGKPPEGKYFPMLLTCRPDGSELRVVLDARRWREGKANHPTWHPNGRQILMNVGMSDGRRFALIDADTGEIEPLVDEHEGIGHPTVTPDGRALVTDRYGPYDVDPQAAYVQWIDLATGRSRDLCALTRPRIRTGGPVQASMRVDLHPVLDRSGRRVAFVGAPDGRRRIFIADPNAAPGETLELA